MISLKVKRVVLSAMLIGSCLFSIDLNAQTAPATLYITGNVGIGSGETGGIQSKDGTEGIALSTEGNAANVYSVYGIVVANKDAVQKKAFVRFVEKLDGEGRKFGPATDNATVEATGTNSWNPGVAVTEGTDNYYSFEPGVYNFVIDCRTSPYKIQVQKNSVSIIDMQAIGHTGTYTGVVDSSNKAGEFLVRIGDKFYTGKETGETTNALGEKYTTTLVHPLGASFELAPYDFSPHDFTNKFTLKMATKENIGNGTSMYTTLDNRRFFYNPERNYFIAINSALQITTGANTSAMTYNPQTGTFTGTVGKLSSSFFSKTGFFIGENTDNYVYGNAITKIDGNLYSITPQLYESGSGSGLFSTPACVCTDTNFSQKKVTFDPMAMTLLLGELDTTEPAAPDALYFCGVQPLKKQTDTNIYSGVVSITKLFDDIENPAFYVCENSSFPYGYAVAPTDESLTTVTTGTSNDFGFDTSLLNSLWQLNDNSGLYLITVNWDTKKMVVEKLNEETLPEAENITKLETMDYANFTGDVICEYNEGINELYVSDERGALFNIDLHNASEEVLKALSPENFKRGDRIKNFGAIKLANPHTFTIFSLDLEDGTSPYIVKAEEEYPVPEVSAIDDSHVYKMVSISGELNIGNYVSSDNVIKVGETNYVILSNFAMSHLPESEDNDDSGSSLMAIVRTATETGTWAVGSEWPTFENFNGKVTGVVTPHNDGYAINATNMKYEIPSWTGIENVSEEAEQAVYFNLQGMRIENPTPGIYIRKVGTRVDKVIIR